MNKNARKQNVAIPSPSFNILFGFPVNIWAKKTVMSIPVGIIKTISCQNFNTDFNVFIFLLFICYNYIKNNVLHFNYPLRCRAVLSFRGDALYDAVARLRATGWRRGVSGGFH
jgi:hypothetical protein